MSNKKHMLDDGVSAGVVCCLVGTQVLFVVWLEHDDFIYIYSTTSSECKKLIKSPESLLV